jgi:hypothetical protein
MAQQQQLNKESQRHSGSAYRSFSSDSDSISSTDEDAEEKNYQSSVATNLQDPDARSVVDGSHARQSLLLSATETHQKQMENGSLDNEKTVKIEKGDSSDHENENEIDTQTVVLADREHAIVSSPVVSAEKISDMKDSDFERSPTSSSEVNEVSCPRTLVKERRLSESSEGHKSQGHRPNPSPSSCSRGVEEKLPVAEGAIQKTGTVYPGFTLFTCTGCGINWNSKKLTELGWVVMETSLSFLVVVLPLCFA